MIVDPLHKDSGAASIAVSVVVTGKPTATEIAHLVRAVSELSPVAVIAFRFEHPAN